MANGETDSRGTGRSCARAVGCGLVGVALVLLGVFVALALVVYGPRSGTGVPTFGGQAALELRSRVATSVQSFLPPKTHTPPAVKPAGSHPRIVPSSGPAIQQSPIAFSFDGIRYSITPHVATSIYWGAKRSTRLLVQTPGESQDDWTRAYYHAFADDPAQKAAIDDVCLQLRAVRDKAGLDSDQYLECIAKFVQSIPYDWKAFDSNTGKQRFAVETLVDGKGLCGDKSVLLADLLVHEGYSAALLEFGPEKHMAVGVSGPGTTYGQSAYLFLETTGPIYVTDVPEEYSGGMRLRSTPVVIAIGSGARLYNAADQIRRIIAVRDSATPSAEALYRQAKQQQLAPDQANAVNKKLDLAYHAATSLRSNVVDKSGKSVGTFMDRTTAIAWIDRNAWWL